MIEPSTIERPVAGRPATDAAVSAPAATPPAADTRTHARPAFAPVAAPLAIAQGPGRRGYLDWMRGLGVVIMVGWHTLDAWTTPADKASDAFWYCQLIGGFGAPIFLFLAGVSVALASGSRLRKLAPGASAWPAAWRMVKRGGWIWVLAILFRLQSDLLGGRTTIAQLFALDIIRGNTLKVDILNVMGPAIAGAAAIWGLARTPRARILGSIAAAAVLACATPGIRAWTALDALPDALEGYLRPFAGRTTFSFFPWAGFVFAGAAIGVLIDATRDVAAERRLIVRLAAGGIALWILAGIAAQGPSWFGPSDFWRTAPSFFFLRVAILVAGIAACYAWEARPRLFGPDAFSPMRQFGVTSLFVYWIHVEMAYGGLSKPIRGELALPWAIVAFLLFLTAMLGLSVLKSTLAERWHARRRS
jgi:uncharacterized membrane protein